MTVVERNSIILKQGKEKAIRNRHHWIFSGAVVSFPKNPQGQVYPVVTEKGEFLGNAYCNDKAKILARMLTFKEETLDQTVHSSLQAAYALRKLTLDLTKTTAFRLVNGEGDLLPGLIVDVYGDHIVLQIGTLGMEKLKGLIVKELIALLNPQCIYEKSTSSSRKEEGLPEQLGVLHGTLNPKVEVLENGHKFLIDIEKGQKTGFFLDHREMRKKIGELSKGKRVLNCFSYTGGFSIYALAGGASQVDSVDISEGAIQLLKTNVTLNKFESKSQKGITEDVFAFLRNKPLDYDIIILDPPAFAKRQKDVVQACRGYKEINRVAMQKMPKGSLLLTCSCSYHVDEKLFQTVVFQAAVEAGRVAKIIDRHTLAADHPINLCHPESDYLKSLLLYIE